LPKVRCTMTPEERSDDLTDWLIMHAVMSNSKPVYDKILEALQAQDRESREDEARILCGAA